MNDNTVGLPDEPTPVPLPQTPSPPPRLGDGSWFATAFETTSDMVFVLDADTNVVWLNRAGAALVGLTPEEVVGRSIADYVHPDDIGRAIEVFTLAATGVFENVPITTALYRVRNANGNWVAIGVNASTPQPDGSMLLIARHGGDLVLADQILEAVTGAEPFHRQAALVLQLGIWRYPNEGYAILYDELDGSRRAITSLGMPDELCGRVELPGPAPWVSALTKASDVALTGMVDRSDDDPDISPALAAAAARAGMSGVLAAPVHDPGSANDACIVIWTTERGPSNAGHGYLMENMRRSLALVLQQRAQLVQLERAAHVDTLTNLTSRARFFDLFDASRVAQPADREAPLTVLYIDLDGFKVINDTLGHTAGDQVLVQAARRLRSIAPPGSTLARLGGDEFVLACRHDTDPEAAKALAATIVTAMSEPMDTDETSVTIGASVGVAIGRDDESPQAVLDAADRALLQAKADGRGCWRAR